MRKVAPALSPLFRSQLQGELLATLALHPLREWSISDLAAHLGFPVTSVHDEVSRLVHAGVLLDRRRGRARMLSLNRGYRSYEAITDLAITTFGAPTVVAQEFAEIGDGLVIYGSWAARYLGKPGPPPRDVDVLVIGSASREDAYAAARRCEARLRIDVNPMIRSLEAWHRPDSDPLIDQIVRRPYLTVMEVPHP